MKSSLPCLEKKGVLDGGFIFKEEFIYDSRFLTFRQLKILKWPIFGISSDFKVISKDLILLINPETFRVDLTSFEQMQSFNLKSEPSRGLTILEIRH